MRNRIIHLVILGLTILFCAFHLPENCYPQISGSDLKTSPDFKQGEAILPDSEIEILFNRRLAATEKIAILIGNTDVSMLFARSNDRLKYNPKIVLLPIGSQILTVYLIESNGNWIEISRFPLSVSNSNAEPQPASPNSDEEQSKVTVDSKTQESESRKNKFFNFLPSITISLKSQTFQSNFPIDNRPETRATFGDFTITGSVKNEAKIGILTADANFDFAGSSFKEETLQFGTKGRRAPDIDLASYLMNFEIGKAKLSWGHTSYGNNRNLVNSFSSRGLTFEMPINKRFDVSGGVLNGTSLVGFGNFSGMGKIRHQIQSATFGVEFFPKRQKAMRLEITGFNGYFQAVNSISEGRVNDVERSRGFGLRFITSDRSERFRLDFGYSLSRFFNPRDRTLDPNGNSIPLPAVLRSAAYVEAAYQILKNFKLTESKKINLNFSYRFEIAEPLYKSLGASASADRISHDFSVDGSLGEIVFQFGNDRANDNLRNVPSILRSLTRGNRFSIALPLSSLIGKSDNPSPFLPRFGYSLGRTHQFGASIPTRGGFEFDPSSIPDLVNTNQTFSSSWQFEKLNFEYLFSQTFADNRRQEFDQNDLTGSTHGFQAAINPRETFGFNVGLNFDESTDRGELQTNRAKTFNFGATWQPFKGASASASFSNTFSGDAAQIAENRNANFDVQFAYNFGIERGKFKKFGVQVFVRFADTFARRRNSIFELSDRQRTKIVNAGLTFNFF